MADREIPGLIAVWRCNCYVLVESVGLIVPRVFHRLIMKKNTKNTKTPAQATKITTPPPARKSNVATKIRKPAATSPASPAMTKPRLAGVSITAKIDAGFGNALFIRGSGAGLTWGKGIPLTCVANDAWSIILPGAASPFAFKLLLNDEKWSAGKDYLAGPGDTVTVSPGF